MVKLWFLLGAFVVLSVHAKPYENGEYGSECYGRQCPSHTTACKKVVKTSADKKFLTTNIFCLDVQDMVLQEHNEAEPNPYGPFTHVESTHYSSSYSSSGDLGSINLNVDNRLPPITTQ